MTVVRDERAGEMLRLRTDEKLTLQQIGDRYGISRERVRQILAEEGMTGTPWRGFQPHHYRRVAATVATLARLTVQKAKPGDEHFPHGTTRGYSRGCSCSECRRANRERVYAGTGFVPKRPRPEWEHARTDGSHRAAVYGGGRKVAKQCP